MGEKRLSGRQSQRRELEGSSDEVRSGAAATRDAEGTDVCMVEDSEGRA